MPELADLRGTLSTGGRRGVGVGNRRVLVGKGGEPRPAARIPIGAGSRGQGRAAGVVRPLGGRL